MPKSFYIILILAIINNSCETSTTNLKEINLRDSVLKEHLARIEKLPYYDTNNLDYRLLKAYFINDSTSLKKIDKQLDYAFSYDTDFATKDSCIHLVNLKNLNADTAYRYIYSQAFSPYITNITISKKRDSLKLHLISFQYSRDSLPCELIDEFDKGITSTQWAKFNELLIESDFWGLKYDNDVHGLDGSSLWAYGFVKGDNTYWHPTKVQSVYRWSPHPLALYKGYSYLLDLVSSRYKLTQELELKHFDLYFIQNK